MTLVKPHRIKQSKGALDAVLHGRVIAIDPASGAASNPGYCVMQAGVIQEYGILQIPGRRAINTRLKAIHETIRDELPAADMLVIEDIPPFFLKKFHRYVFILHRWSRRRCCWNAATRHCLRTSYTRRYFRWRRHFTLIHSLSRF